ncbi:addiction module protein [Dechloromonas sp. A34]|uniref:addiction module protein n=1 Tax=Dechloromonas sp. A34 TaxID=447588 RepID=UPI0022490A38|nr:addiction module protein [Dechloromonas sp. A34]
MSLTYEQIAAEALRLSPEKRADLADLLWISVDRPVDVGAAWIDEAERRADELEAGQTFAVPVDMILSELRAKYPKS